MIGILRVAIGIYHEAHAPGLVVEAEDRRRRVRRILLLEPAKEVVSVVDGPIAHAGRRQVMVVGQARANHAAVVIELVAGGGIEAVIVGPGAGGNGSAGFVGERMCPHAIRADIDGLEALVIRQGAGRNGAEEGLVIVIGVSGLRRVRPAGAEVQTWQTGLDHAAQG